MKKISKKDKILYSIFIKGMGKKKVFLFEDIVVFVHKFFPGDFSLSGYPEYPDSDIFRRAIYFELKPQGLLRIKNKQCVLTDLGIERATEIGKYLAISDSSLVNPQRININYEIQRMTSLKGFELFINGRKKELIDQDFYDFFKVSVRTKPLELSGNITQINSIIKKIENVNKKISLELAKYSKYLEENYLELLGGGNNEN